MIYEFPDWVQKGAKVKDNDDNEWVIVDSYVTGSYNHDWGRLVLEHASIPGLEAEVDTNEVEPV